MKATDTMELSMIECIVFGDILLISELTYTDKPPTMDKFLVLVSKLASRHDG